MAATRYHLKGTKTRDILIADVGTIYDTSMRRTTRDDKTEKVGITLPISLVKQTDKARGDIPRSTFIRRAVEQYIRGKDGK